jgi:hypothetical protein
MAPAPPRITTRLFMSVKLHGASLAAQATQDYALRMILIIADPTDPHVRVVLRRLTEKGAETAVVNLSEVPARSALSVWIGEGRKVRARMRREREPREIDLAKVEAVWLRRMTSALPGEGLAPEDARFVAEESTAMLVSLALTLGDRFWVNPLAPSLMNDHGKGKLSQLELAQELGLSVPRTLATNDPEAARAFVESVAGGTIYKPFHPPAISRERDGEKRWCVIFTTKLDAEALAQLDSVREAPCIFQEYVPKKLELRITVMGDKVFACEIHSQVHAESAVDFRKHYALESTPYHPHELPREVAEKVLALHRRLGLVFGACDVILTPDGRYVFLEVNPQGQFLWLEDMVGLPLLENFTELLIQRRRDFLCDAKAHAPGEISERFSPE